MFDQRILPTGRLPARSRRPAGKGEQLQEDSHRPASPSAVSKGRGSPTAASREALGLVVRRHVREDRTACGRRCEGQRRGLHGKPGVTGCASSTSNRLRGRPVAATASGGVSGGRRLNAETAQVAPLTPSATFHRRRQRRLARSAPCSMSASASSSASKRGPLGRSWRFRGESRAPSKELVLIGRLFADAVGVTVYRFLSRHHRLRPAIP